MDESILSRIKALLATRKVDFKEIVHAPTYTSEESAAARHEQLGVGAKALLLRTDDVFRLFVVAADKKLDSGAVKRHLGVKRTRFATAEELLALTGLVPGSVPPFGEPILPFELFADPSIGSEYPRIAFNAGSLTTSIIMAAPDWHAIARPQQFSFAKS